MIKSLKRNILSILCFSLIFLGCGTFYDLQIKGRTYKTSAQIFNKTAITTTNLNTFTISFKSDLVVNRTVEKLNEDKIYHKNGSPFSFKDIYDNVVIPTSNNSTYITISLVGKEKNNLKDVLSTYLNVAIDYLKNETGKIEFSNMSVFNNPSDPIDVSHFKQNMIIYILVGFCISYLTSLFIDYKYDLVYDQNDIKNLSTNVLELNYTENKLLKTSNKK